MSVWERFESIANKEEVATAKKEFEPLDEGEYVVLLEKLEATESQQGLPMVKGQFRIVESNRIIFYNQNLQNLNYPNMTAQNIAEAQQFVNMLLNETHEFETLGGLADLIGTVPMGGTHKIKLSYGKNDKETRKYPKLKVLPYQPEDAPVVGEDDVPWNK